MNENSVEAAFSSPSRGRARGVTLNPLHEAALRLAGIGLSRSRGKTKDLVAMLISHGARAWRHSQPEAQIHLHLSKRSGRTPVRIRLR
jgi:hypothetical protein